MFKASCKPKSIHQVSNGLSFLSATVVTDTCTLDTVCDRIKETVLCWSSAACTLTGMLQKLALSAAVSLSFDRVLHSLNAAWELHSLFAFFFKRGAACTFLSQNTLKHKKENL